MRTWMSEAVGRGLIESEAGEGLYSVSFDYGASLIQSKVDRLDALIATHANSIDTLESALTDLRALRGTQAADLTLAISNQKTTPSAEADQAVDAATKALTTTVAVIDEYELRLSYAKVYKSDCQKQRDFVAAYLSEASETKDAWCCDYTEEATGHVATIEVNGEQPRILIAPGAPTPTATDGLLYHRMALSPEAAFLNAALLPGWQKYSPTYRVGSISNIDRGADTCTVTLDAAASSAQELNINQKTILDNVPIEYMTCNSLAFENFDDVVVQFDGQSWDNPKVIGFASNPRPCGIGTLRTRHYIFGLGFAFYEWWSFGVSEDEGALVYRDLINAELPDFGETSARIVVEAKRQGDMAWEQLDLTAVTRVEDIAGVPGTGPVQWIFRPSGYAGDHTSANEFQVGIIDTTGDLVNWGDLAITLPFWPYPTSYNQDRPLVVGLALAYGTSWGC